MCDEAPARLPPHGVELPEVPSVVRGTVSAARVPALSFSDIRAEARRIYCSESDNYAIQVSPTATVLSAGAERDGHWVKAWVWVSPEG